MYCTSGVTAKPSIGERGALVLRKLLGKIRLEPTKGEIGRPYYRAVSELQALALLEPQDNETGPGAGSNSLHWWRRRESNPFGAFNLTG